MDLDELIAAVEETGSDGPLDRVSAAAALKDQIEALGDELLDHFVKEARDQGCSWTQVGEALGVTRQAAQQRHGGLIGRMVRGTDRGPVQALHHAGPGRSHRRPGRRPRPAGMTGSAPSTYSSVCSPTTTATWR